jgi:hypothetical protein
MKTKTFHLLIILLIFVNFNANGQLSGYYTIGGASANYQTLPDAISDLYQQGINDDVTFALNPGTYPGITFIEIPGASADNRFVLQSSHLDSTEVIIEGTIYFNETKYVSIIALTVSTDDFHTIDFFRSKHIFINNCVLNSDYPTYYSDGSIEISHFWPDQGDHSHITISHCAISSNTQSIHCTGYNGYTTINNCEINSGLDVAMEAKWCKNININNCTFNGGLDMNWTSNSNLRNNTISGEIDIQSIDSLLNSTIFSTDPCNIRAAYFGNNHFSGLHLSGFCRKFIDNYFEMPISIGHATNIDMIGNVFKEDVHLSFNKTLLLTNNTIYKQFYYGDAYTGNWNYKLYNNLIIGGHIIARGHNSTISYNNFIDDAYLYVEYGDIMVYDNNFCQGIEGNPSPENVIHNNYFPLLYCFYDTASIHYDPGYDISNIGIATNPLLQGKGQFEAPIEDFNERPRNSPSAVGANEICICSDSLNNILSVPCGEELYLNICNIPDTGNFWWTPDSCFSNPDSCYTSVTAFSDMTLYLYNSIYGIIDSVILTTEPFQVEIAPMPVFYCGYARTLNASYHPNADYHWTPEQGLSDPYIRNPKLLIEDTTNMQYILECSVEECGVSYDTLNIEFDGLPHAQVYYPEQSNDTVFFLCTATCTDGFLWDFGDGKFSNEQNPYHVYTANGYYDISLTVSNDYGSNTYNFSYYFYVVTTPEYNKNERIRIYPNPVKDKLIIESLSHEFVTKIQIFNSSGIELIKTKANSEKVKINTSNLENGLYIVFITTPLDIISRKIIIMH